LPLSSDAKTDQGCRKRRNRVPDWSEIRCRFPPKSPAAFDRNPVPVCPDSCILEQSSASIYVLSRPGTQAEVVKAHSLLHEAFASHDV
jgi:hypothetical protein